jgi:GntP family gluconate:H+ symporter
MSSGLFLVVLLILSILFIVWGTARWRMHPFLILLVTSYGFGLLSGLPAGDTIGAITRGFGNTLGYIGIVIAAGTIIGVILEKGGGALVMANTVIRLIGEARSSLAMSLTGAVVSIPVFCDSGFVILSPLSRSLAVKARQSMATFAVALSMGLYATHVFVPPTPGPVAAAGELGADLGAVILLGLVVTIPVIVTTYLFALLMGRRIYIEPKFEGAEEGRTSSTTESKGSEHQAPAPWKAFAPVVVPMLLIALQSVAELPARPFGEGWVASVLSFCGDPNTALILGVFLAFLTVRERGPIVYSGWVGSGLREAGTIILITGAGGALGSVLQATPLGDYLGSRLLALELSAFSIFLPFLLAAALKTALGSSTVAIITTASILSPLLGTLGLADGPGPALAVLAIGAGSMTVSHANDSYFWVVSQFSGMEVADAYKLQTLGSAVAGVTGIVAVFLLGLFL